MKIKVLLWVLLAVMIAGDAVLEKKNRRMWEAVQLPANIFCGILSLGLMVMVEMGVGEVAVSRTDFGSKALFFPFAVAFISALMWGNVSTWKRWLDMKKKR